jgi:hypothetical protein
MINLSCFNNCLAGFPFLSKLVQVLVLLLLLLPISLPNSYIDVCDEVCEVLKLWRLTPQSVLYTAMPKA